MSARWRALALLALAAAPAGGQQTETVSYWNAGAQVDLIVHLDSLGIVPAPDATDAEVQAAVPTNFQWVRSSSSGQHVVALPAAAADLAEIFDQASALRRGDPDTFGATGPLARYADSEDWVVVLTEEMAIRFEDQTAPSSMDDLQNQLALEPLWVGRGDTLLHVYRVTDSSPGDVLEVTESALASPFVLWAYPSLYSVRESTSRAAGVGGAAVEGVGRPSSLEGSGRARDGDPRRADGLVGQQWHLSNASDHDVNAPEAWTLETGDPTVVIAVIENKGFDTTHPDLAAGLGTTMNHQTGTPDVNVGSLRRHATAAAGLAAGATGAGEIKGVCPDCSLMLLVTGGGPAQRYDALQFARLNGAHVVSASWDFKLNAFKPVENAVVDLGKSGRGGLGTPVVMSSGNNAVDICSGADATLAAMQEVTSVSVSDDLDHRVSGYPFGGCLDLLAPGHSTTVDGVLTSDVVGTGGYNSNSIIGCSADAGIGNVDYTTCFGGSSAATPIVAGVAALIIARDGTLTGAQVRDILVTTANKIECSLPPPQPYTPNCADPYAHSLTHGFGRVDAHAAVVDATPTTPPPPPPPEGPSGLEVGIRAGWTDIDGGSTADLGVPGSGPAAIPVLHVTWFASDTSTASDWMLELQFGARRTTTSGITTTASAIAIQGGYMVPFSSTYAYVAASFAGADLAGSFDTGPGLAVGLWERIWTRGALRGELRGRYWSSASVFEVGLAIGLGLIVP